MEDELRKRLMERADEFGLELRALITECKTLPKSGETLEPYQLQRRSLELAQEHLQTGMLWLRRCIVGETKF